MTIETTEIIIYTESLYTSNLNSTFGTKTKICCARDAPNVAELPIKISIPHKVIVRRVLGVWYQPIEGLEQLDGFTALDVENKSDPLGDYIQLMLKATSLPGVSKQVKIRIFVLYEQGLVR